MSDSDFKDKLSKVDFHYNYYSGEAYKKAFAKYKEVLHAAGTNKQRLDMLQAARNRALRNTSLTS